MKDWEAKACSAWKWGGKREISVLFPGDVARPCLDVPGKGQNLNWSLIGEKQFWSKIGAREDEEVSISDLAGQGAEPLDVIGPFLSRVKLEISVRPKTFLG